MLLERYFLCMRHFRRLGWPEMVFDQPPASQDPGDSRICPATHRQQRKPPKSSASRAGRKRLSKTTPNFHGSMDWESVSWAAKPLWTQRWNTSKNQVVSLFYLCHSIHGMLENTTRGRGWTETQQTKAAFTLPPSLLMCWPWAGIAGQRSQLEFFCEGHETIPSIDNDGSTTMK